MNYSKVFLVSLICIFLFACSTVSKKENISTNINTSNSIAENVGKTSINTKNDSSEIVSKIPDAELTPSEVFREFDKAIHIRDSDKIKRHITKDSIAFFEEEANEKGITFKELIEQTPVQKPIDNMPEIKSEKIDW